MDISRRSFLKGLGAASSLAVLGVAPGLFADDIYRMVPGETLSDLHFPDWSKIVMENHCTIERSLFNQTTQIEGVADASCCLIKDCIFKFDDRLSNNPAVMWGRSPSFQVNFLCSDISASGCVNAWRTV